VKHRTRVVIAGWVVFSAVFFTAGAAIPESTDALPLVVATAVTVLLTPVLHVQLAQHAEERTPVDI
jgi:low temperature requirement protein LtrA